MLWRLFVLMAIAGLFSPFVAAQEPRTPPAELKQLEPFVGSWKVEELVSKKAEWSPEEIRTSGGTANTKWILKGWYLEDRKTSSKDDEHLGIWHYDPADKSFHYTMFQAPGGHRLDLTVKWAEKLKVFEGTAQMPRGVTMRTAHRFSNGNTVKQWQLKATDAEGKMYLDISCKEVRVDDKSAAPPNAKPATTPPATK